MKTNSNYAKKGQYVIEYKLLSVGEDTDGS